VINFNLPILAELDRIGSKERLNLFEAGALFMSLFLNQFSV
jgi:hypothetical protein